MTDTRIVILGGGFSGVEVPGDHILPELSPRLGEFAERKVRVFFE